jgi:hypothetical protein
VGGVFSECYGVHRERLWDVNLNVLDVFAVPNRLEQTVGEPKGQNILGCFLAEEMVNSKDLVLGEDLMHRGIEPLCAR